MRFLRRLSRACVYAGCYSAWAWLCMVLTATKMDVTEVHGAIVFFSGAVVFETLRLGGRDGARSDRA